MEGVCDLRSVAVHLQRLQIVVVVFKEIQNYHHKDQETQLTDQE